MIRRREFITLLGGAAVAWPLAAYAQTAAQPTQATRTNVPKIEVVRVKPIDPAAPELQFQLGDGSVDLMKDFSLSSAQAIGGIWETPPYISPPDTFDERYGQW